MLRRSFLRSAFDQGRSYKRITQVFYQRTYCTTSINEDNSTKRNREFKRYLQEIIQTKGPITVSHFIREALTNEKYGYYTCKPEVLGSRGDFVTAPEISQMFGELIGIWIKSVASNIRTFNKSRKYNIIELGPGKGTLAVDMTRALSKTKDFTEKIHLHLVEASPILRKKQAEAFGLSNEIQETVSDVQFSGDKPKGYITSSGITIDWYRDLAQIQLPPQDSIFLVAQEFLDALPVSVFEYTKNGWREVCIADDEDSPSGFKYVISKVETPGSVTLCNHASVALPSTFIPKEGERIEISFSRATIVERIAELLGNRGVGLFIDYGNNHTSKNTLRGIKDHKFVDILETPGESDITNDVDFQHVARVFELHRDDRNLKSFHNVFGPITQGGFLKEIGIQPRVLQLLNDAKTDEQMDCVTSAYRRLTHNDQMGSIYKVLAVAPDYVTTMFGFPTINKF